MKIILDKKDINKLFKDTNCVVLSDWEGTSATINRTDEGKYYMVRWEEYDPCTGLLDIDTLVNITLSEGVVLCLSEYASLFND